MTMFNWFVNAYFIGGIVANTVLFIIQAKKLYDVKDSTGLSMITFGGFNLIQLSTILYGFANNDKFLFFGYLATFIACFVITMMIPYYKKRN